MTWIALAAIGMAAVVGTLALLLTKRPVDDLGSVSATWIAHHRASR